MKRISFLLLALTFSATQSFALQASSGKLIYHKEWSTGNIKSIFTENNTKPKTTAEIIKKFFALPQADQWILTRSKILKIDVHPVGKPTHIEGDMSFRIINFASEPQTYTILRGICASYAQGHQYVYCSRSEEEFVIDRGDLYKDLNNQVDINFPTPGDWYVVSVISVQNSNDTKLFDSEDERTITIPKS